MDLQKLLEKYEPTMSSHKYPLLTEKSPSPYNPKNSNITAAAANRK